MSVTVTLEYLDTDGTDPKWVAEEIKLNTEEDFALNDDAIDYEMERISNLIMYYGNLSAELKAQSQRKKQNIEWVYSDLLLTEKSRAVRDKEKPTESAVKAVVYSSEDYNIAHMDYINAEKDAGKTEHFYRTLLKKADICIAISYKKRAEIARNAV